MRKKLEMQIWKIFAKITRPSLGGLNQSIKIGQILFSLSSVLDKFTQCHILLARQTRTHINPCNFPQQSEPQRCETLMLDLQFLNTSYTTENSLNRKIIDDLR